MANGLVSREVVRLTDQSAWTHIVHQSSSADELVRLIYRQILSREPSDAEQQIFGELLSPGFASRVESIDVTTKDRPRLKRGWISWSNHLNPEASRVKSELEAAVRRGTPPTRTINADYRERVEDMVWALLNSPEFVFIP